MKQSDNKTIHVPMHTLRDAIGQYATLAIHGHTIIITRRGKPIVKLVGIEQR